VNRSEMMIDFQDSASGYRVVVDDDGRVAYAYLLEPGGKIVGDVWLYNREATPDRPEWNDKSKLPFLNSARFAKEPPPTRIDEESDVSVNWSGEDPPEATLFVRGQRYAVLRPGAKPGWSAGAKLDGPLAKVLS
jgi:hypothetical protein